MRRDSVAGTFLVAAVLCIVCSVVVSSAAVALRDIQDANALRDKRSNVLQAAGLIEKGASAEEIKAAFKKVEVQMVNLDTGEIVSPEELASETYDPIAALDNSDQRTDIPADGPRIGGAKFRERYTEVYLVKQDGELDQVVMPFWGSGLWGLMRGFISLDSDLQTVRGLTFYDHKETPGLGGEVESKNFKEQWPGTKALDDEGNVLVEVLKAGRPQTEPDSQIDGLSGATITTNGVNAMVRFWLGPMGFGPYLDNLRAEGNNG
ncbi:MAG: Na(+)-translocating NADH-quinone reductase subunit C [Pirellulaceae bacterium]